MIAFEEELLKNTKSAVYNYYAKIVKKKRNYEEVTKNIMYQEIKDSLQENPEIILESCTKEELSILKALIINNVEKRDVGYLEYITINNLKSNYLINENPKEYYIPTDMLNYIKMAINLLEEESFTFLDIEISVAIGLTRIYNVLSFKDFYNIYKKYCLPVTEIELKKLLKNNYRANLYIKIVKYQKEEYVVSKEFDYYKDILALNDKKFTEHEYSLEEVVCFGKYRINLLKKEIFEFLNFLECHLEAKYIYKLIDDIIVYKGFLLNDEDLLNKIAGNIKELYIYIKDIIKFFPNWIIE